MEDMMPRVVIWQIYFNRDISNLANYYYEEDIRCGVGGGSIPSQTAKCSWRKQNGDPTISSVRRKTLLPRIQRFIVWLAVYSLVKGKGMSDRCVCVY